MSRGSIKPLQPLCTDEEVLIQSRANCAERARERGADALALSFEHGGQDQGWAMRHEVAKLASEAAS